MCLRCPGRGPCDDRRAAVLHRLRRRAGDRAAPVPPALLHPRHEPAGGQVAPLLDPGCRQQLPQGLLRARPERADARQGGHRQLRQVQVAAALLALLRGVQVRRAEPAEERRDHRGELDGRVRRRRPGAGAGGAVVPRDHGRLEQQVGRGGCTRRAAASRAGARGPAGNRAGVSFYFTFIFRNI